MDAPPLRSAGRAAPRLPFSSLVPALVASLAAFVMLALVLLRGVDLPFWDEWEWAGFIYASHTGALSFDALWAPHNEHRMLLPRLVMLGLDALRGWDVVREEAVSVALLALTQLGVWALIARTVPPARRGVAFLAATVVLFGLSQYENLGWGFQMAWFICNLGLVAAVWALSTPNGGGRLMVIAVMSATAASVSSSQGLLVWLAGLVVIVLMPRRQWTTAATWLFCAVIVTAVVRSGSPGAAAAGHSGPGQLAVVARYVLVYLGSPVATTFGPVACALAGASLLAATAALWIVTLRATARRRYRAVPWLAVSSYAVAAAAATAAARAGFGVDQALQSRYTTISGLAWIAVVVAAFALAPHRRALLVGAALPACVLLAGSALQSAEGYHQWKVHAAMLRTARASIAAGSSSKLDVLYPNPRELELILGKLARIHDGPFSASR